MAAPAPARFPPNEHLDGTTLYDWKAGDLYHNSFLIRPGEEPVEATENANKNDIDMIAVSAAEGKFLKLVRSEFESDTHRRKACTDVISICVPASAHPGPWSEACS